MQSPVKEPREVCRHITTSSGTYHLPTDMKDKAVMRLGLLGLLSTVAHVAIFYGIRAAIPAELLSGSSVPAAYMFALWAAVAAGLIVFGLAFSRKVRPELMLDIGLIFEVAGAFLIGFQDTI